jgi:shikimate kinase
MSARHLVITGLMGAGKTTAATAAAARLGRPLRDSDHDLEQLFGIRGVDIAAGPGVDELHRLEEAVLLGALASDEPSVIAAAGWVVESRWCRLALASRALVVVLDSNADDLASRSATGSHRRPVSIDEFEEQRARRQPLFAEVADLTLDASLPAPEIVDAIVEFVQRP